MDFQADDFVTAVDKLLAEMGKPDGEWNGCSDDDSECDDDDYNANLEEIRKMHNFKKDSKIFDLMQQMDEELSGTEVGKTFSGGASSSSLMTKAAGPPTTAKVEELDDFDKSEEQILSGSGQYEPVNVDMNALANILESLQSQDSPVGPSANLLRSVGFDPSRLHK